MSLGEINFSDGELDKFAEEESFFFDKRNEIEKRKESFFWRRLEELLEIDLFTEKQKEIIDLWRCNKSTSNIAEILQVSRSTVRTQKELISKKLRYYFRDVLDLPNYDIKEK